jgi:phosphate:Na+ symporter
MIVELLQSLVWLLAGVGVFIVGMNFMSGALERTAGSGMKNLLGKISNNRFSGVCIGAGVTAIIQSSSATTVMVIGLINAGVMTLTQATSIIMGANIGTTITGVLVSLKNDVFNTIMYLSAFAGVMMGFFKSEKVKNLGQLLGGLGLIFVGLNIMSSEQAFGSPLVEEMFMNVFQAIDFPLLLILVGVIFTALIQSSSAATGVVITMVGVGVLELDLALYIVLGANIGTCVTAVLAAIGASTNAKRAAFIHLTIKILGVVVFAVMLIFKEFIIGLLVGMFPGSDPMSLQMRVAMFHVIFNTTTTILLLPFVNQIVKFSQWVIPEKKEEKELAFKYVDERLLSTPPIALMQVKKEMDYMLSLAKDNMENAFHALYTGTTEHGEKIVENEKIINFTNNFLSKYLIKLSSVIAPQDEKTVGTYFHVLNDVERIGDHAENFHEIGVEMQEKGLQFSAKALEELDEMHQAVLQMFAIAEGAFISGDKKDLPELTRLEDKVDAMKKELTASHFARLADGSCLIEHSPYFSSTVAGLERVADHLINVGYSILNPTGSQSQAIKDEQVKL